MDGAEKRRFEQDDESPVQTDKWTRLFKFTYIVDGLNLMSRFLIEYNSHINELDMTSEDMWIDRIGNIPEHHVFQRKDVEHFFEYFFKYFEQLPAGSKIYFVFKLVPGWVYDAIQEVYKECYVNRQTRNEYGFVHAFPSFNYDKECDDRTVVHLFNHSDSHVRDTVIITNDIYFTEKKKEKIVQDLNTPKEYIVISKVDVGKEEDITIKDDSSTRLTEVKRATNHISQYSFTFQNKQLIFNCSVEQ